MALGSAAVLAQVITLAVGDRAELRWRVDEVDSRFEAEDTAYIAATISSRNSSIGVQYSPSIIVSPLESSPRDVGVFHHVGAGASITWQTSRRTTVILSQSASYDRSDTSLQGLSSSATARPAEGPVPGTEPDPGQPPPPAATDVRVAGTTFQSGGLRSEVTHAYVLTRISSLRSFAGYHFTSGLGESRETFPFVQGPDAGSAYTLALTRRDTLTTSLTGRYDFADTGDRAWSATLGQGWARRLARNKTLTTGVGVSYVYTDPDDAPNDAGVYPNAQMGYAYNTRYLGGVLTLELGASYAPVVDRTRLVFDARLGVYSALTWSRNRLTLYARTSGVVSAEPDDPGALNSVGAAIGSIYDLGYGFSFEAGARGAWSTFERVEILPPSAALFVALTWGGEVSTR